MVQGEKLAWKTSVWFKRYTEGVRVCAWEGDVSADRYWGATNAMRAETCMAPGNRETRVL